MIGYLILAVSIIGISLWLSIRSLQRERLLPGSEIYTTVEIVPTLLSERFFHSLFEKLANKHSGTVTVLSVARPKGVAIYLRIPTRLLAWVRQESSIKRAPAADDDPKKSVFWGEIVLPVSSNQQGMSS